MEQEKPERYLLVMKETDHKGKETCVQLQIEWPDSLEKLIEYFNDVLGSVPKDEDSFELVEVMKTVRSFPENNFQNAETSPFLPWMIVGGSPNAAL